MKRRRPATATAAVLAALVGIIALLSGCGSKVIDHTKAEEFIRQDLAGVGVEVENVSCPSGVKVGPGVDFECSVAADGEKAVVQMRIVDDEGRVKPIEIRSADANPNDEADGATDG